MYHKARNCSLTILRCFYSKDPHLLFRALIAYVRPIIEYCCSVWCPFKLCEIRKVEAIQKRFTKRLKGLEDKSYKDRLNFLKAESLELRRIKADLTMCYKILHNAVKMPSSEFFELRDGRSTRGHSLTIYKPRHKTNLEKFFFSSRVVKAWNKLPQHVANASNVNSFKRYINKLPSNFYVPYLFIK